MTTASLGHTADQARCATGWRFNADSRTVSTPALPSGGPAWGARPCLAYLADGERELNTGEDDAMLVARECDAKDPAQAWAYDEKTHLLSSGRRLGWPVLTRAPETARAPQADAGTRTHTRTSHI